MSNQADLEACLTALRYEVAAVAVEGADKRVTKLWLLCECHVASTLCLSASVLASLVCASKGSHTDEASIGTSKQAKHAFFYGVCS